MLEYDLAEMRSAGRGYALDIAERGCGPGEESAIVERMEKGVVEAAGRIWRALNDETQRKVD